MSRQEYFNILILWNGELPGKRELSPVPNNRRLRVICAAEHSES